MKRDMNLYRLKGFSKCQAGQKKLQPRYIIVRLKKTGQVICTGRKIRLVSYFSLATTVSTTGSF